MSHLLNSPHAQQRPSVLRRLADKMCPIHRVPKDILLRLIAVLLEDDDLIHMAQCSHLFLQSLRQADLRHPYTLQQFIEHRPESKDLVSALTPEQIQFLQREDGWKIPAAVTSFSQPNAASASSQSPSSPPSSSPSFAIGQLASIRWRPDGASSSSHNHDFFLPLFHHLPRSIRSFHSSLVNFTIDYQKLSLPTHLTELTFHRGAQFVKKDVIEKLVNLEILQVEMSQVIANQEATSSSSSTSAPTSTSAASEAASSFTKHDLRIHFPASLHTLTTVLDNSLSADKFAWPGGMTSLTLNARETDFDPARFPPLPPTLKHLKTASTMNKLLVHLINNNLLPPSLESIDLGVAVRPLWQDIGVPEIPVVWKSAKLQTIRLGHVESSGPLILPVHPLTGICSITHLTLPTQSNYFSEYLQHLHLLTQLLRITNFFVNTIREVVFPPSLQHIEFNDEWLKAMNDWKAPPNLRSLKFGRYWDIPLTSLLLPPSVESLHFGHSFSRAPPANYVWPTAMRSLTFDSLAARQYWEDYAESLPVRVRIFVPVISRIMRARARYVEVDRKNQCRVLLG